MFHKSLAAFMALSLSLVNHFAIAEELPQEQVNPRSQYNEPTRGFFIEHAMVKNVGEASVELFSGSDIESGGAIRLGLPGAELIINNGLNQSYDQNELLLKWAMPDFRTDEDSDSAIQWSLIGGLTHFDLEAEDSANDEDQTNLKIGVAATIEADAGIFTVTPEFVLADGDVVDDNFFNVGIGAYVGIIDTKAGLFSLGAEAIITSQDDRDDTYTLGARWAYNKHLTIDFVPFIYSDADLLGVPGVVRLNATF